MTMMGMTASDNKDGDKMGGRELLTLTVLYVIELKWHTHMPNQLPTQLAAHLEKTSLSCGYYKCSQ